jgi:hypothetical protein
LSFKDFRAKTPSWQRESFFLSANLASFASLREASSSQFRNPMEWPTERFQERFSRQDAKDAKKKFFFLETWLTLRLCERHLLPNFETQWNGQQNDFKKDFRAKTPRMQRKSFSFSFWKLGSLCVFARDIFVFIPQSRIRREIFSVFG